MVTRNETINSILSLIEKEKTVNNVTDLGLEILQSYIDLLCDQLKKEQGLRLINKINNKKQRNLIDPGLLFNKIHDLEYQYLLLYKELPNI